MLIFAKWFHVFYERSYEKQGDYRAHYVNRFRDLLIALSSNMQLLENVPWKTDAPYSS